MSETSPHDWFKRGLASDTPAPRPAPAPDAKPDELDENAPIPIDLEALAAAGTLDAVAAEEAEELKLPEGVPTHLSEKGPPADAKPLPSEPVTQQQLEAIADRLEDMITEYCRHGVRIGISLSSQALIATLDRVLAATDGDLQAALEEGSAEAFFAEGLYEELIDQPNNIFDPIQYSDGNTYWMPISTEVWRDSVLRLKARVEDESES